MSFDEPLPDEQLGRLIAALPPAPEAWTQAARDLPATLRALEDLQARVLDSAQERAVETADLEEALRRTGVEPTADRVAELRGRLG